MAGKRLYIGIDIDDKAFHIAGYDVVTSELYEYKCKPIYGALKERLLRLESKGYSDFHICYEASYIGFHLCKTLLSDGFHCDVIAPSLIPVQSSSRTKTDRLDSRKLAIYYAKDLLTPVAIPDEIDAQLRRLIKSRSFLVGLRKKTKQHILSRCRVLGIDYRQEIECPTANYWTQKHLIWLSSRIKKEVELDQWCINKLLEELLRFDSDIELFDSKIEELAETDRYRDRCLALNSFKGLQTLSSMTLISELGDIRRFSHPSKIVSYAGMDIAEYSSGGKEKKFGMTKMGSRQIRTTLIEACQTITPASTVGKQLRMRRTKVDPQIVNIAQRCQERLYKKKTRMLYNGKHNNKIKAACAREMIGFIWEALGKVA